MANNGRQLLAGLLQGRRRFPIKRTRQVGAEDEGEVNPLTANTLEDYLPCLFSPS